MTAIAPRELRAHPVPVVVAGSWFALGFLTLAMLVSYVDRFVVAILVQPIEADLHLSDTQMGAISGIAFAGAYGLFVLPTARWADKRSRRNLVVAALVVWSTMTALCGTAQSFVQLLLARIGVGAGEAGGVPTSHSILADLFPLERRNTAMAIFSSGATVGLLIGFAIGGWLDQKIGWRATFAAVAFPGLLLAAVIRFAMREPPRGRFSVPVFETPLDPRSALITLWKNPGFRHLAVAYAVGVLLIYGQTQWLPAFFQRSFGVQPAQLGVMIALTQGLGTFAGTILGGLICDHLARSNPLWPMRIAVASGIFVVVPRIALYLASNATEGYAISAIAGFVGGLSASPLLAIVVTIVPSQIRATASAILLLMTAILGMGGGPFLIGWLSDMLKPALHAEALRYSLLSVTVVTSVWVSIHYIFILRYLADRLRAARAKSAS